MTTRVTIEIRELDEGFVIAARDASMRTRDYVTIGDIDAALKEAKKAYTALDPSANPYEHTGARHSSADR